MEFKNPKGKTHDCCQQPSLNIYFLLPFLLFFIGCAYQQPDALVDASSLQCEALQTACRSECSTAQRCDVDCKNVCTAASDSTHCKYDSATHSCDAADCTGDSCTWVGSSQPTYSDCLVHCASTQAAPERPDPQQSLVLSLCRESDKGTCGGGELEDQKQCSYNSDTGECHAVSCPSSDESCSSVGSTQPTQSDCFTHCAVNE